MHGLAERLAKSVAKSGAVKPGDRVCVAVSGGSDSVALLLLLVELRDELGIVVSAVHVNHKLRGEESDDDQDYVEELCRALGVELHAIVAAVAGTSGIEAAARELRYEAFRKIAAKSPGLKIATGHTRDDQAETVLLRIMRGTGIRGLAGIHPRLTLQVDGSSVGEVVRPLLGFRRAELQDFLRQRDQCWREDSSNRESKFVRNRIRHEILPRLGDPAIENLADLAEIARAEDEHWNTHPEVHARGGELEIPSLLAMPLAAQRRLIRAWIEVHKPRSAISFRVIEDVLELANCEQSGAVQLSFGHHICRAHDVLRLERETTDLEVNYEYRLAIPGEIEIPELGMRLQARLVDSADAMALERDCLLAADRVSEALTVRNWRAGDRFWPAHTKGPRKIKELLNDRHITGEQKRLWPVALVGNEVVWMRGFPTRADFRPVSGSGQTICIQEITGQLLNAKC